MARKDTVLRPIFSSRRGAIVHIRLVQRQYDAKGFDQAKQVWWARRVAETPIHRWTIEETRNGESQEVT
jgi:hypothetical protein